MLLLQFDGGSTGNPGEGGSGCIIYEDGSTLVELGVYHEKCTNNEAEYVGLIIGLHWLVDHGYTKHEVVVQGDSQLVIKQIKKEYAVKAANLKPFYQVVNDLIKQFTNIRLQHVYREYNTEADRLSNEVRYIRGNIERP